MKAKYCEKPHEFKKSIHICCMTNIVLSFGIVPTVYNCHKQTKQETFVIYVYVCTAIQLQISLSFP